MLPMKSSAIALAPRRPNRRPDDADIHGGEHRVERGRELGVAFPNEKPKPLSGVVEIHEQVAGLLGWRVTTTPETACRRR